MKTVRQFVLRQEKTILQLPKDYQLLGVGVAKVGFEEGLQLVVWAKIDSDLPPTEEVHLHVFMSEDALPTTVHRYVGTAVFHPSEGNTTFHVFETFPFFTRKGL